MKLPPKIYELFFEPYVFIDKSFSDTVFDNEQKKKFRPYLHSGLYCIPKEIYNTQYEINRDEVSLCIKAYKVFRHNRGVTFSIDIENNTKLYPIFVTLTKFISKFVEDNNCTKQLINIYLDYYKAVYAEHEKMNRSPQLYQLATAFAQNAFLTWIEDNYPGGSYFEISE